MPRELLVRLALDNATYALAQDDVEKAWGWLETVSAAERPAALTGQVLDRLSRAAASRGEWEVALRCAADAGHAEPTPGRQGRVGLLRHRTALVSDHGWQVIKAKVPPAARIRPDSLQPEIRCVAACGAYYSRSRGGDAPWSKYLRLAKALHMPEEERAVVFGLAAGYFARFIAEDTGLLLNVDAAVPVPANPMRYVGRMGSLPDDLARVAGSSLGLLFVPNAVAWRVESVDIEMKRLGWSERRRAADTAFCPGPQEQQVRGRAVLLVDDITTSGSTLRACARVLLSSGAASVDACVLAHTEG